MDIKCDCCPEEASKFYKTYARNRNERDEYHAFCKSHCDLFERNGEPNTEIPFDRWLVEYVMES